MNMTREEQAIVYFKDMRKRMCEDHLKICPKDSVAYRATLIEKGFYDAAIKALEQVSTTKNDLGVDCMSRQFQEIVVEYPPEDLCTYPEYKGKPYFSIKYKEGNDYIIGYGTYKPEVFSRYLRDYFMPSVTPQEPRWIPVSERLPEKAFGCLVTVEEDDIYGEMHRVIYPDFVGYDGETWNDADGNVIPFDVIAWMPLPKPYREVVEE